MDKNFASCRNYKFKSIVISMKTKHLKEYFGTQRPSFAGGPGAGSNFYSGADLGAHTKGRLGTRGADSKFSQRMQAIIPNDYYDLLEEDEELDEDYVVENSRYSLEKIINQIHEQTDFPGIDPTALVPYAGKGSEVVDAEIVDAEEVNRASKTADEFGLDLGRVGIKSILNFSKKKIPVVSELYSFFNIVSALKRMSKNSDDIFKSEEKLKSEIESKEISDLSRKKKDYIKLFLSGIKDIEKKQKQTYEDFNILAKNIVEILPTEALTAAPAAVVGTTATPAGTAAGGAAGYLAGKAVEIMAAGALGELIEKSLKTFVESQEVDSEEFSTWVKKNDDPNSSTLKFLIFFLDIISRFPGAGALKSVFPPLIILRALDALFVGAKLQNILAQKISLLQSSEMLSSLEEPQIHSDDNLMSNSDDTSVSATSVNKTSNLGNKAGTFARRLFVSKPEDAGKGLISDLFSESLENKKLIYLLEEDIVDEEVKAEGEELEEFSGVGAVAGFTLTSGASPRGPKGAHSSTTGGKAYPYSSSDRSKFNKFSKKTFGGK